MKKRTHNRPGRRAARRPDAAPGQALLYGRQPIRELLVAGRRTVNRILLSETNRPSEETDAIIQLAEAAGITLAVCRREELDTLLGDVNHQGVAAEAGPYPYFDLHGLMAVLQGETDPLLLVLDHLEDPQNAGSLLRTAEAAGVAGVLLPSRRACPVTPAVVRASAGASEHLRIAQVPNIVQAMLRLREAGFWFVGLERGPEAKALTAIDLTGPLGIVVGSEGGGLKRLTRETCDFLAELPMRGHIDSLNAGVAGAIALYTVLQQRLVNNGSGDQGD